MSVLFIHSSFGDVPPVWAEAAAAGRVTIIRDAFYGADAFASAPAIITTTHLDQLGFAAHADALAAFFRRGGRLFFNGHVMRPFIAGLSPYRPLKITGIADFALTPLVKHPLFDGFAQADMVKRKGVAGFYGRGHNPMPQGARAATGLGPQHLPIDWEWALPGGGMMFSHAGNDLWSMAPEGSPGPRAFAQQVIAWAEGAFEEVSA